MGSREAGNEKAREWAVEAGAKASAGTFADAAAYGDLVFNCTAGEHSITALEKAGVANLAGKVLVDVANVLDFSGGRPPSVGVGTKDSLGEQIQHAFPDVRVVKARGAAGLAAEPLVEIGVLGEVGQQHLQRHHPVDGGVVGAPHFAHSALTQQLDQLVAAKWRPLHWLTITTNRCACGRCELRKSTANSQTRGFGRVELRHKDPPRGQAQIPE